MDQQDFDACPGCEDPDQCAQNVYCDLGLVEAEDDNSWCPGCDLCSSGGKC